MFSEVYKNMIQTAMRDKKGYLEKSGDYIAVTQTLNAQQLFLAGIRYFHVHIELLEDEIYISNSLLGKTFSKYIDQLEEMLSINTGEIVVLHIEKTLFTIDERTFDSKVESLFKSTYKHTTKSLKNVTFSEIMASSSSRLVVIYPRLTNKFWPAKGNLHFRNDIELSMSTLSEIIDSKFDESLINVIKASTLSDFDEIMKKILGDSTSGILNVITYFRSVRTSVRKDDEFVELISSKSNLKNKILSMNMINYKKSIAIINKNGDHFIK